MRYSPAIQRLVDQAEKELARGSSLRSPYRHPNRPGAGAARRRALRLTPAEKVRVVMGEFKRGTLRSGSGQIVRSRDQAIAIALSEAGLSYRRRRRNR